MSIIKEKKLLEFKEIYKKNFWIELTDKDALNLALKTLTFLRSSLNRDN